MSREGSVAPKERVNIVYKPATGNAQEEVELPLKIMMVGDYTLRSDDTPLENRKPTSSSAPLPRPPTASDVRCAVSRGAGEDDSGDHRSYAYRIYASLEPRRSLHETIDFH